MSNLILNSVHEVNQMSRQEESGISKIDRGSMKSISLTPVCVKAGYDTQRGIRMLRVF
ncbi:unnamed protein product [Brassica oleracea]